jgi:hypothetical protein
LFAVACAAIFWCAGSHSVAASFSPRELYLQALNAMSNVDEPPYVTFELRSKSAGLAGYLTAECHPCLHPGNNVDRWSEVHRTSDYESQIVDEAGGRSLLSYLPILDPTWFGAYRALRIGIINTIGTYRVPPLQSTPPPVSNAAAPKPDTSLKTIAVVATMGPGIYHIQDRGDAPCPNGDPGHALHLWSRTRNPRHQLSDVIIDLASLRFCLVRFSLNGPGLFGGDATLEEHFGEVGGYWVETDGVVDGTQRVFGIAASHGKWYFRLIQMQFPKTIPDDTFQPTPTKD